ncbi:MAG: hypothetical protein KJ955_07775 [Nanoarchaeota archaeon]|nr:hypothetical protein [Nanoarchaeota archaeon]
MFRKRNIYNHDLRAEQERRDARIAKGVAVGLPALVVAVLAAITCNMNQSRPTEPGYVPLDQAEHLLENCSPRAEDINGNGMYETLCEDAEGNHYEAMYRPDGSIRLKLAVRPFDLTRSYAGPEFRE